MCGIYGITTRSDEPLDAVADRMSDSLQHRGPDHRGRYCSPGVVLGMNRLAILDLEGGNQPIANEDGSLVIIYNGELYNHHALRRRMLASGHTFRTHSDTETILHAYEEYGHHCVDHFDGMFAFAIYHTHQRRLFLARDRLGIKPLYISELCDGIAFASEAKALLHLQQQPQPDWNSLAAYFCHGYVPAGHSPFAGISALPAGHIAWRDHDDNQLHTQQYWAPSYGTDSNTTFDQAVPRIRQLLDESIQRELLADVPVGVFLSGGLDSSAVALYARRHTSVELHTFGVRFSESTHDESGDARLMADHLGSHHHEFAFTDDMYLDTLLAVTNCLDQPFADSTVLPLYALSRYASQYMKVVLTGWGGDELFAGYPTYRAHQIAQLYRRLPRVVSQSLIPALVRRLPVSDRYMSFEFKAKRFVQGVHCSPERQHLYWMGYFSPHFLGDMFTPDIVRQWTHDPYENITELSSRTGDNDVVSRIMALDAAYFLEGNGLFQADRMTMASSLEARVPLLNVQLFDYVAPLATRTKMPGGRTKHLLRQAIDGMVPDRILDKPKKGFGPPTAAWMRGMFADVFERAFEESRIRDQGVLQYDTLRQMFHEHRARKADHGRCLWSLLSFQLWYERFILGNTVDDIVYGHSHQQCHTTAAYES